MTTTPEQLQRQNEQLAAIEAQKSVEEYKKEKQKAIEDEIHASIIQSDARVEKIGTVGLPDTEVAALRSQYGLDAQLAQNTQAITELTENMKGQLDPKAEPVPVEAPTFVAEPESQTIEQPEGAESIEKREKIIEGYQEKRASLLVRTLSGGADFIPFAGGIKMTGEALVGTTTAGQKMTGKERLIHGAVGAGSTALDFFGGAGAVAKGARLGGKSIGLIEKIGAKSGPKIARVCARTGQFMAKHPELTKMAEEAMDKQIERVIKSPEAYKINNFREQQQAA